MSSNHAPPPSHRSSSVPLREGTVVLGRYRIDRLIDRGAMGYVFDCRHMAIGRRVALKVLAPEVDTPQLRMRFQAEARMANAAQHRSVVEILDAGQTEQGHAYIAMEFLEGRSLRDEIEDHGAMGVARACALAREVADALAAIHEAGIVHRDIKPDNIMLLDDGGLKVVDFGIAQRFARKAKRFTRPGEGSFGTPEYMAPEQARCRPPGPAFDIYALGVVLFEMLTGDPPIRGRTLAQTLSDKIASDAPAIASLRPDLPPPLASLVDRCLARDPQARPTSAREVVQGLAPYAASTTGESVLDVALAPTERIPGHRPRTAMWVGVTAAMVSALAVFGGATRGPPLVVPPGRPVLAVNALTPATDAMNLAFDASAILGREVPSPAPDPLAEAIPPAPTNALPVVSPKPPPAVTRTPPGEDPARVVKAHSCPPDLVDDATAARAVHDWRRVLDRTRERDCWDSDILRSRLRVLALLETKRFEPCMRAAAGSRDPETLRSAKLCRLRAKSGARR